MAQVKTDHITRNTHCLKIENFAHGCTKAVSKVQVGRSQKEVVDYHSEQGQLGTMSLKIQAWVMGALAPIQGNEDRVQLLVEQSRALRQPIQATLQSPS